MDILTILFSLGLSDWLHEIIKEMVGDTGWSAIKQGILKFIGRDAFEECFDATIEKLMTKYPKYLLQLDVLKDLKAKSAEFPDKESLFRELERRGVTVRVARFLVDKLASEYQKVILDKAKENEAVFKHVVIGYLASIHPLLEKNTEMLQELVNIIEERTRVWSSLDRNMLSSFSTDNVQYSIHYERVVKTITILNDKGDAEIRNFMECRNGSSPLFSLKSHSLHSGATGNEVLTVMANGKKVIPKVDTYRIMRLPKSAPTQTNTEILLNFKRPILPGSLFTYEVAMHVSAVFPALLTSEFTSYKIQHPTRELLVEVKCPTRLSFLASGIDIDARDEHGNRAAHERNRLIESCIPILKRGNRQILWRVNKPVVGLLYRLCFRVSHIYTDRARLPSEGT